MRNPRSVRRGYLIGLAAAVLFGLSAPVSKVLLDRVEPQLLAGLLYLGAFLAVGPTAWVRRSRAAEAPLQRRDVPRLAVVVLSGGVAAPVLLLLGLERVSGVTGSLLLNLEGTLTLVIGVVVFREHLGLRGLGGAVLIFTGAAALGLGGATGRVDAVGALLIGAACLGWAIDNNVTQTLTSRDPFAIVAVKAGVAAAVNIAVAVALGAGLPAVTVVIGAALLGSAAYGVSILLDAYALRALGAVRESAVFATAPFAGALLAVPLLAETWSTLDVVAAIVMAGGLVALVGERHDHRHFHEPLVHEHRHVHDEHHRHQHPAGVDSSEPHSHPHRHERLVHSHPHVSDAHHRHSHRDDG